MTIVNPHNYKPTGFRPFDPERLEHFLGGLASTDPFSKNPNDFIRVSLDCPYRLLSMKEKKEIIDFIFDFQTDYKKIDLVGTCFFSKDLATPSLRNYIIEKITNTTNVESLRFLSAESGHNNNEIFMDYLKAAAPNPNIQIVDVKPETILEILSDEALLNVQILRILEKVNITDGTTTPYDNKEDDLTPLIQTKIQAILEKFKVTDEETRNVVAKQDADELRSLTQNKYYDKELMIELIKSNVFSAAKNGKIDFVNLCLEIEPSLVNSYDARGMTLLHNSIFHPELVKKLLSLGVKTYLTSGKKEITAVDLANYSEIDAARMLNLHFDPENEFPGGAKAKRVAFRDKHQAQGTLANSLKYLLEFKGIFSFDEGKYDFEDSKDGYLLGEDC